MYFRVRDLKHNRDELEFTTKYADGRSAKVRAFEARELYAEEIESGQPFTLCGKVA